MRIGGTDISQRGAPLRPPFPGGKEHLSSEALHTTGGDIDQQPQDFAVANGFQVLANRIDVPTRAEFPARLEYLPGEFDEVAKTLFRLKLIKLAQKTLCFFPRRPE